MPASRERADAAAPGVPGATDPTPTDLGATDLGATNLGATDLGATDLGATDVAFMQHALEIAAQAAEHGDVPVGALVVQGGRIVGVGRNRREVDDDPVAHAEIVALRDACRGSARWRVDGATLYVTLEPCPMCAGAIVNARVARLVYGAADPKAGAVRSLYCICDDVRLNHRVEIVAGVLADPCAEILRTFFRGARSRRAARRPRA